MTALPAGVSDTFVHPCLTCGTTVQVQGGTEQSHECQTFGPDESLAAFAWWQGHDYGREQREHEQRAFNIQNRIPTNGPDQGDVDALRGLLDLMADFESNDQRARYLLTSNWFVCEGHQVANRAARADAAFWATRSGS